MTAFDGLADEASEFLKGFPGQYYVYVLCRPDGRPFYVGKGTKRRLLEHELEARRHHPAGEPNPFKSNVIRKILREGQAIRYRVVALYPPEDQLKCLEKEAALIKEYGRLHEGGCLTNLAGGLGSIASPSPFSLSRHASTLSGEPANNPERLILNRFIQGIGPVGSVPVKPIAQLSKILPTTPHPKPRKPTKRAAYALIASASATGRQLNKCVRLPRTFSYEGVSACIENGVARDILKAGMADLLGNSSPQDEVFCLSEQQIKLLRAIVGDEHLSARGLI